MQAPLRLNKGRGPSISAIIGATIDMNLALAHMRPKTVDAYSNGK